MTCKTNPCRVEELAAGTATWHRRCALSQRKRQPAQCGWRTVPVEQAPHDSLKGMPVIERQAGHCPSVAPYHGNGPLAGGS